MSPAQIPYAQIIEETRRFLPELPEFCGEESWAIAHDLPHLVFGHITEFVISEFRRNRGASRDPSPGSPLGRAFRFLEEAYERGDEEVQNLVEVSFLENLHTAGEDLAELRKLLPARLRKALDNLPW